MGVKHTGCCIHQRCQGAGPLWWPSPWACGTPRWIKSGSEPPQWSHLMKNRRKEKITTILLNVWPYSFYITWIFSKCSRNQLWQKHSYLYECPEGQSSPCCRRWRSYQPHPSQLHIPPLSSPVKTSPPIFAWSWPEPLMNSNCLTTLFHSKPQSSPPEISQLHFLIYACCWWSAFEDLHKSTALITITSR